MVGREHEIAIDDDPDREAGSDGESRLDVDLAAHELLAGLVERVLAAAPQGSHNVILGARRADLAADAKKGRKRRRFQETAPMIVHAILEPRIAVCSEN